MKNNNNHTHGSTCDSCGKFISDQDAGFCVGLHNLKHENCGGNWWVAKKEDLPLEVK